MNAAYNSNAYQREYGYRQKGPEVKVRKKAKTRAPGLTATVKDKRNILLIMLIVGILFAGIIVAGAYAASINYQNNALIQSNTALQGEVESLQIEIKGANNIANIEKKATKELGMIYPEGKSLVVVSVDQKPDKNFAGSLKKSALE